MAKVWSHGPMFQSLGPMFCHMGHGLVKWTKFWSLGLKFGHMGQSLVNWTTVWSHLPRFGHLDQVRSPMPRFGHLDHCLVTWAKVQSHGPSFGHMGQGLVTRAKVWSLGQASPIPAFRSDHSTGAREVGKKELSARYPIPLPTASRNYLSVRQRLLTRIIYSTQNTGYLAPANYYNLFSSILLAGVIYQVIRPVRNKCVFFYRRMNNRIYLLP